MEAVLLICFDDMQLEAVPGWFKYLPGIAG